MDKDLNTPEEFDLPFEHNADIPNDVEFIIFDEDDIDDDLYWDEPEEDL